MGFAVFRDRKHKLLDARDLRAPDGRALYAYRLRDAEFAELEGLLREWLGMLLDRHRLADLTRLSGFSSLFVLYGSEWWRRRFDGSHWSWEPILRDLGADPDEWSPPQRSEFVRLGLQDWGLQPRAQGGLRFLGAVALQGGLPLRLLAEARGGIGRLLHQVLRLAGSGQVSQSDLLTWVRSLDSLLPKTYRQDAILVLLADVVWTVLELRDKAGLQPGVDALARLDERLPGWRDRFPLPIEDEHARQLIEQLIRDAAETRVERVKTNLPLVRRIVAFDEDTWALESGFDLPDTLPSSQLAALFGIEASELPRFADFGVRAGETRTTMSVRRLAGVEKYRIDRQPCGASGRSAAQEHFFELSASDGHRWIVSAPRGEELDDDLPWVFAPDDGGYRLVRQGGGKVAAVEVLVAMPAGWTVGAADGASATAAGKLAEPERTLLRLRGVVSLRADGGLCCTLRTGEAGAREESYAWKGDRLWLDFQQPAMAFRGRPQLYVTGDDGTVSKVDGAPGWHPTMGHGPVVARYPASGSIAYRARLLVLPDTAGVTIRPNDARSGSLAFKHWGATLGRVLTDGVLCEPFRDGDSITLKLATAADRNTPERVEVELLWPQATTPVRLSMPFPAKGVRFFDAAGGELASGALIAVQKLSGSRMMILGGVHNEAITLELQSRAGGHTRTHPLRRPTNSLELVLRPLDYAEEIHQLLSMDDSPDSRVQMRVRIGGAQKFTIDIARYAAKLERNREGGYLYCSADAGLSNADLDGLKPHAMCLERPGDETLQLVQVSVAEGETGFGWAFTSMVREPGSWLIYPAPDGSTPFRPTLWRIDGDSMAQSALARTLMLVEASARETALDEVIAEMALDFQHEGWPELEQLAAQVGHLPLATLDLWRRFARSPDAMAALAFRFGNLPAEFVDRFAHELPFAWEAVGFSAWRDAISYLLAQCKVTFGEGSEVVFRHHLKSRIESLTARHGALQYLLGIASSPYDAEAKGHVGLLRYLGSISDGKLLGDEDSLVMRLLRTHAEDQWPEGANTIIASARADKKMLPLLCPERFGFHDSAINLPLLLAAQAAQDATAHWFGNATSIHHLRTHRAFDPEWFDDAYNHTISYCLARGTFDA